LCGERLCFANIFFYLVYHFHSVIESANLAFFGD
jgi:hypothetical protein